MENDSLSASDNSNSPRVPPKTGSQTIMKSAHETSPEIGNYSLLLHCVIVTDILVNSVACCKLIHDFAYFFTVQSYTLVVQSGGGMMTKMMILRLVAGGGTYPHSWPAG